MKYKIVLMVNHNLYMKLKVEKRYHLRSQLHLLMNLHFLLIR